MLVGTKDVNFSDLKASCTNTESLRRFSDSLVPLPLLHLPEVVDNQRYLVALYVRQIKAFPWQRRKDLCEALLNGVHVRGVADYIYDYADILAAINIEKFNQYLEEEMQRADG